MSGLHLSSLPNEVLKLILQHVPLDHRLSSCSLVSRAFHAAAAAATEQLEFDFNPEYPVPAQHSQNFLKWLSHNRQHVKRLHLCDPPQPMEQELLLLNHLEELRLVRCPIQLGPDGQPGFLRSCTKLTRLELYLHLLDAPQGAGPVVNCSFLTGLQHLKLGSTRYHSPIAGLSCATLPRLQRLTHLDVSCLSADNMRQLSALTALRSLELHADRELTLGPSNLRGLVLPASLTKLVVWSRVEAELLSVVPTGLRQLEIINCAVEGPAEGPGSFLIGMARLTQLTRFELSAYEHVAWPPPGPAYSALTASSGLVELTMAYMKPRRGIWPYVFPAGHTLPHLTRLALQSGITDWESPAWSAADLASLVGCCRNVRDIRLIFMQHGPHVSELHKLTALTCIGLHYGTADSRELQRTFSGLAAVTQLLSLSVHVDTAALDLAALLPLTALTALTSLVCSCMPAEEALEFDSETDTDDRRLDFCTTEGTPSDVWLQLLLRCAEEPSCRCEAGHSLAQQLVGAHSGAVHRELAMHSYWRLVGQQQQIDGYKQRIAQQEQQIGGLEQQLFEHKRQAAEQLAALQGQLQDLQAVMQQLLQRQPAESE